MESLDQIGRAFLAAIGFVGAGVVGILIIVLTMWLGIKLLCRHDRQTDAINTAPQRYEPTPPTVGTYHQTRLSLGLAVSVDRQMLTRADYLLVQELLLDAPEPVTLQELYGRSRRAGERLTDTDLCTILFRLYDEKKVIRLDGTTTRWKSA